MVFVSRRLLTLPLRAYMLLRELYLLRIPAVLGLLSILISADGSHSAQYYRVPGRLHPGGDFRRDNETALNPHGSQSADGSRGGQGRQAAEEDLLFDI